MIYFIICEFFLAVVMYSFIIKWVLEYIDKRKLDLLRLEAQHREFKLQVAYTRRWFEEFKR